jgi:5'-deoxynucleotidase YfbR-like HD superfamily hydrolase
MNDDRMASDPHGWMTTYTGLRIWPCDLRASDILLTDIAHGLSIENRFGGHTFEPYSVAQHSLLVFQIANVIAPIDDCEYGGIVHLGALFHDAAEAYIKDIPTPIKRHLGEAYREIEIRAETAVASCSSTRS